MIEILILYILYNEKNTLYGIRKVIKEKFLYLTAATFGTIHPAMSRLIEKNFVSEKKSITEGGRRKHFYTLTKNGKEHLLSSIKADISTNSGNIEKQLGIKLVCSDILDENFAKGLYLKIIKYYEQRILLFSKILKTSDLSDIQKHQIQRLIENYQQDSEFLKIKIN